MSGFADHLQSRVDMDNCLVCQSPTRSHVLLLAYEPDSDSMVAVDHKDDADGFGPVCHGCYTDADGDAEKVARLYDARLDELLDAVDATKEQLANDPESIDVPDDFDLPV